MIYLAILILLFNAAVIFTAHKQTKHAASLPADEDSFVLRQPSATLWLGTVSCTVFCLMMVLASIYAATLWDVFFLLLAFDLLALYTLLTCILWEVQVQDGRARILTVLRQKREFQLQAVTSATLSRARDKRTETLRLYEGKKRLLTVESGSIGYELLKQLMERRGLIG